MRLNSLYYTYYGDFVELSNSGKVYWVSKDGTRECKSADNAAYWRDRIKCDSTIKPYVPIDEGL